MLSDIISQINSGSYDNPIVTELLLKLSEQMKNHKGKKVYGYLLQAGHNTVNAIADELAKEESVTALYAIFCLRMSVIQVSKPLSGILLKPFLYRIIAIFTDRNFGMVFQRNFKTLY